MMRGRAPLMVGNGHAPPQRPQQNVMRQKQTKIEEFTGPDGRTVIKKTSLTMEKTVDHGDNEDEVANTGIFEDH